MKFAAKNFFSHVCINKKHIAAKTEFKNEMQIFF